MSLKKLLLIMPILFMLPGLHAHAQSDLLAVIETDLGDITLEFFPDDAPRHVENFVDLAEAGFYDGTVFHRIIPGFMIQGGDPHTISGDPSTWGAGGPADSVDAEFNNIKHKRGILSMARSSDPNSAGSQFFIVHQDSSFLDGQYTVFGRVVTEEGLRTLDMIAGVLTGDKDVPLDPDSVRITKLSIVSRSGASGLLLELPEPERTGSAPPLSTDTTPTGNQRFESQEHQFAFVAPAGWLLQEPVGTDPGTPDVVAVGPRNGVLDPFISIMVEDTNQRTTDEVFTQVSATLDDLEASGLLDIVRREVVTVSDHYAYVVVADTVSALDDAIETRFHQVLIYGSDNIYTITYVNGLDDFDSQLPAFQAALDSFVILSESPIPEEDRPVSDGGASSVYANPEDGGGCLIATAAIGSELSPQIQQLRELRDNTVSATVSGSAFMAGFNQFYYSFSPAIADMERQNPAFKEIVRLAITPLLSTLPLLNHAGIDSEAEMLGYGIGIILLNVGVYAAVPATAIYTLKKVARPKSRTLQTETNARQ